MNTRKAKERIYTARTQLESVSMQLQAQISMAKVSGCLQKSTEVMQAMSQFRCILASISLIFSSSSFSQRLIQLPELRQTMMDMAREMERVRPPLDDRHIYFTNTSTFC